MRNLNRAITVIIALCLCLAARAMTHLNASNGLSGGSVFAILKDSYGLMWFATSNGLNCYNGLYFKTYVVNRKRSMNAARDVVQTADGTIYAGIEGGLYTPDMEHQGLLRQVTKELKEDIHTLATHGNTLFVGTESGLYIVEKEKIIRHILPSRDRMSTGNNVTDLLVDGDALWVLTVDDIYRYDQKTQKTTCLGLRKQMTLGSDLRVMALEKGRRMFIGGYNDGLFSMDMKTHRLTPYKDVGSGVITSMQVEKGKLYVATDGAGVSIVALATDSVVKVYNTHNGLTDNSVYSFLRTPAGNNWFGYYRRGISQENVSRDVFRHYATKGFSTRGMNVRSFWIDGQRIVIGTRSGLYYYDGTTPHYFSPAQLSGGSIITSIVKYGGKYYFSTFDHGVYRLDPTTLQVERFTGEPLLRSASFGKLAISPAGELWMAGNAGVFIYNCNTERLTRFDQHNSQLYDAYANSLLFDRQGRCWIGTHKGICVYNPVDGVLRATGFPKGFNSKQREPHFILGPQNDIISYSAEGLYHMDEGLTDYGEIKGNGVLGDAMINVVVCDTLRKQFWVGTEHGLFRFDSAFRQYRKYGAAYGMTSTEFSTSAAFIDSHRRLWIGTMDGLLYTDLDKMDKKLMPPATILLADITIGGQSISDKTAMAMLRQRELTLDYLWGTEELTFRPALLNFIDQHDMYYEYRIGKEGEWQTIRNGEKAATNDFTLGINHLYVRIAGTRNITEYTVYVKPSAWFVIQLLVGITLIVVLVIYYRNRKELARVREDLAEEQAKYRRVRMSDEESATLFARLKEHVEKNKSYLDPDLKLTELATALECSTARLSQLLNIYAQQNYYDFINAYRLEEFKRRLNDPKYAQYTIVALSEMCGFKKSSFFAAFKKMEGMTPSEYVRKVKK